jgi:hypothetical protein
MTINHPRIIIPSYQFRFPISFPPFFLLLILM